jgi:hypothetical protein
MVLGVDGHRRSVVEYAGNLVAEGAREAALLYHVQIATADAGGANMDEYPAGPVGLGHLNHVHAVRLVT